MRSPSQACCAIPVRWLLILVFAIRLLPTTFVSASPTTSATDTIDPRPSAQVTFQILRMPSKQLPDCIAADRNDLGLSQALELPPQHHTSSGCYCDRRHPQRQQVCIRLSVLYLFHLRQSHTGSQKHAIGIPASSQQDRGPASSPRRALIDRMDTLRYSLQLLSTPALSPSATIPRDWSGATYPH